MRPEFIYLASQSPRRRQLLDQLGMRFELLLPGDDEDAEALEAVLPGELPEAYVARVTEAKLDAALLRLAARGLPAAPVLCSDTTVALDQLILGKPVDAEDAFGGRGGNAGPAQLGAEYFGGRVRPGACRTTAPLCGQWRAFRQGRVLCDPESGGSLDQLDPWQLFGHHGLALV